MLKKYNLIVVGGGFAGTSAAISAGRAGLSVLLIERSNCLGGAAVNALVTPFMRDFTKKDGKPFILNAGLFAEIKSRLRDMDAIDDRPCARFNEEFLKIILNRMVLEANVTLLYHSYLLDVRKTGGAVKSIIVANKSGQQEFSAEYFIDATGDADMAALCGCPFHLGREKDSLCQPMTLCLRVTGVDMEKFRKARNINTLYREMQKQGKIKNPREDVLIFDHYVDGILHFNSTRIIKLNPTDAFDLTKAEIEAREQVFELFNFIKENIDGFQNCSLIMTAPAIGVRESRMIDGEYLLTGEDLISCKRFEDSIAAGNYDIDIHNPEGSGTSHHYFPDGQYYTIPYRSLVPKNVDNLLVAGRCISVNHEAQASIRIMPIVCCIGEAAGTAVGIAAKEGSVINQVNVKRVQEQLKNQNSIF